MNEERQEPAKSRLVVDEDWKSRVEAEKEAAKTESAGETSATAQSETAGPSKSHPATRGEQQAPPQLPPASFSLLVTSLATQAMALLGEAESPSKDPNDPEADLKALSASALELARHAIDTLHMLEEKTRGNLVREESAVLTTTLHELRMMYIAVRDRKRP
jgi:hypothetical protein